MKSVDEVSSYVGSQLRRQRFVECVSHRDHSGPHLDWVRCTSRLTDEQCERLIEACSGFPLISPTVVGEDRHPLHRKGDARKVGVNQETRWFIEHLCMAAEEAASAHFELELSGVNRAPQFVEYRGGNGEFGWHDDYSHDRKEAPRKVTAIIQLSHPEDYEGGDLQMFGIEVETLPRERGTILVFPSLRYHRVTPVTKGLRRALVAWFSGPRIR